MKKRILKSIIAVCLLVCLCLPLTGCFYSLEKSEDGRLSFGVSKTKKDAFCIGCKWSGGDMSFVIPDEFMGYKVTTLGGYIGRGYPCPFGVKIAVAEVYPNDNGSDYAVYCPQSAFDDEIPADDVYDILTFSISLGVNVVNLNYVDGKCYLIRRNENQNGETVEDVLCKIVYSFTVDNDNPKFYAENGRLYYRESGELVTEFFYE